MVATNVLLVEDSGFMSTRVSETLTDHHSMRVSTAETAAGARERLATEDADCLLVNYNLSDETGIEFAASLSDDLPVILFTSEAPEPIAAEAIEAGVTEFVHKDEHLTSSMDVLANRIDVVVRAVAADDE